MSSGCTYVAQSVLGDVTLTEKRLKYCFFWKQSFTREKKILLIAQVKYIHLNKNQEHL